MYRECIFNILNQGHPFYEKRDYGRHEGIDFTSRLAKRQKILNSIAGQIYKVKENHKYYGKQVILFHNAKFVDGVDDIFFTSHCHLSGISDLVYERYKSFDPSAKLINPGELIGNMGNTGNSWTHGRKVTIEEQKNPSEWKGVHNHYMIYQENVKKGKVTPLLKELKKKLKITESDYLYQWDKLFFNPGMIHKYFLMLENNNV